MYLLEPAKETPKATSQPEKESKSLPRDEKESKSSSTSR